MRLLAIASFLLACTIGRAETIYLKNGTILKGSIVEMSETNITLSTADMGTLVIKRRSVSSIIDFVESPAPKPTTPEEAPPTPPVSPPAPAPVQQSVNINNASSIPPQVISQNESPKKIDQGHLYSNLSLGYTGIKLDSETYRFPTLHWDVLSYRTPSGSSFAFFAEGGKDEDDLSVYRGAGIKADWAMARSRFSYGTSTLSFGFHGGFGKFETQSKYYYSRYLRHSQRYQSYNNVGVKGPMFGAQLVYNYLADDKLGFQVGASGSRVFTEENDKGDIVSGFGGISIVF